MNIREKLKNIFPKSINREAPIFSAMIANSEPISNLNDIGTIEKTLYEAKKYTDSINEQNIYNINDDDFNYFASFFCHKELISSDPKITKKRLELLFLRKAPLTPVFNFEKSKNKWGTSFDTKTILKEYFLDMDNIYILPNSEPDKNLLHNGDFEIIIDENIVDGWTYEGPLIISKDVKFSGSQCLRMIDFSNRTDFGKENLLKIKQKILNCKQGRYSLSLAHKNRIGVTVYYENGRKSDSILLSYGDGGMDQDWFFENKSFYIPSDCEYIEISFWSQSPDKDLPAYIDNVILNRVEYPSFTVFGHYRGEKKIQPLCFYGDEEEPDESYSAINVGYIIGDGNNITDEFIDYLLDYLRPVGVRAEFCVIIDEIPQEEWAYVEGKTLVLPYGSMDETKLNVNKTINDNTFKA